MASVTITKSRFDSTLILRLGNLSECARIPNYMGFLKFGKFRPALLRCKQSRYLGYFLSKILTLFDKFCGIRLGYFKVVFAKNYQHLYLFVYLFLAFFKNFLVHGEV